MGEVLGPFDRGDFYLGCEVKKSIKELSSRPDRERYQIAINREKEMLKEILSGRVV